MSEQPSSFRDFGILPRDLRPPPETVRSYLSTGRVVGQYIGTGLVSAVGLGLTALFALTMPMPLSLLGCAAALAGFGAFVFLATHNDYRWVELEGDTLRARRLYTGRTIERSVEEIESLGTMVYPIRRLETVVIEGLLGRVKGIEIRFRDRRTPLRILRADPAMTNARELIEAVLYRMSQRRELDAEVVNFAGQPLVRNIHWKGERPAAPPGKNLKVVLCCLIGLALLFGTVLGYGGLAERRLLLAASVPAHELSVRSLIQDGPGSNHHVTITDFQPGGYAFESDSGRWTEVWVPLFPAAAKPEERKEIKVVLSSAAVRDETALKGLLQGGRVTGICSETPRESWGPTLGPVLAKSNPGSRLAPSWIIEELREPPGESTVTAIVTGAAACFAAVILLAAVIFWKAN